jgi:hypothetical protein
MHTLSKIALGLSCVALWGTTAFAAPPRPVPEEGALEVVMLRQQSVQKELKLNEEAVDKIHKHCSQQWEKAKKIADLSEPERDKKFTELTKENDQFVEKTLNKDQRKRLQEIMLQTAGLLCLSDKEVAAKLNLTEDQKKKLPKLQQEARNETEELIHDVTKEQKRAKLKEIRMTSEKRVKELLTDAQEAKWSEMLGKPFEGDLGAFFAADPQ